MIANLELTFNKEAFRTPCNLSQHATNRDVEINVQNIRLDKKKPSKKPGQRLAQRSNNGVHGRTSTSSYVPFLLLIC